MTSQVSLNMLECPDLFQLNAGGVDDASWVLLGSMAHSGGPNQWWTGRLRGTPPRFIPENVGLLDYGNGYAAKSGSTFVTNGTSRRVVFGFTGWTEPTAPSRGLQQVQVSGGPQHGCGRYLVLPRELTVAASLQQAAFGLRIYPVPETRVLRVAGSVLKGSVGGSTNGSDGSSSGTRHGSSSGSSNSSSVLRTSTLALTAGSQLEVDVACTTTTAGEWPNTGKVALRTLESADGVHYTEVGWDFAQQKDGAAFYVDHTHCCRNASIIVQRALTPTVLGDELCMTVFVDSGMIEAFGEGVVITALVNPDSSAAGGGPPEARTSMWMLSPGAAAAGVQCTVASYKLSL